MIAPAVPACSWSSTATPRARLASWSSRPVAARWAATMAAVMPPEHSAQHVGLGRAADGPHRGQRLDQRGAVGVQAPVPVPRVRVAPRHHEHLLALRDQELDQAAAGGQVQEVVLVDHRRHDEQRVAVHARRDRLVLDQLEPLAAYTTAPGVTARSWPTSKASAATIDGTRGGAARSVASARRPRTGAPAAGIDEGLPAAGLSSGLLLGAAAATRLASRNRQPGVVPPGQFGPVQQFLGRLGRRQVGLHAAAQYRVVLPGRIGEPAVARSAAGSRTGRPRSGRARLPSWAA